MYLIRKPSLWWLAFASGCTNAFFNWGVTIGDVVRVVLLFYLMPVWAVILARVVLKEAITPGAVARVAVALVGAVVILAPPGQWFAMPNSLPDYLAIAGGFSFALNNTLLRLHSNEPAGACALAMFSGGAILAAVIAIVLGPWLLQLTGLAKPIVPLPTIDFATLFTTTSWLWGAVALALFFLVGNLALQVGAGNLPANVTAIVMLFEIVFASVSAVLLGAGEITQRTLIGGGLILGASLMALVGHRSGSKTNL